MQTYDDDVDAKPESIYDVFVNASTRTTTFRPADSPLHEQVGFIVGAPRSGTTWLQQLLLVHPLVATGGESHLFCEGLPAIFENFGHPEGMSHLSTWVSRDQLITASRAFCDTVFMAQREGTRPEARVIVEKTPNHRLQSALQAQIYPDARYVHIVRDGRDATASQRQLWGARTDEFADAGRAAEAWAASLRDIRTHFGSSAYLELRYEDIVADTPAALGVIFDHLGLPHDQALRKAAADFGRAPVHTSPASPNVGVRKHAGDALAERAVARAGGDLLVELGYADRSEVERLRKFRVRSWAAAVASGVVSRRSSSRNDPRSSARPVVAAIADALANSDELALRKVLAPAVPTTDLLPRFGGARMTQRRVVGDAAMLTLVTPAGERAVLRVQVAGGVATAIESL